MSTSVSIGRISSWARPSGRFLSTAIALADRCPSRAWRRRALTSAARLRVGLVVAARRRELGERPPPRPRRSRPGARASRGSGSPRRAWRRTRTRICSSSASSTSGASTSTFSLPAFSRSSSIAATSFLISPWAMSSASSTSASLTPSAPHSTIRIASSEPETIRSISSSSSASSSGLTTKSPSSLPIRTAPTYFGDRDRRDRERRRGAVHRQDVVGVDVVDRQRLADELGLVVPALGEQRPDRAVDHPRGQGRLLAGARLAAEERAGDLARGVVLLLDVDGQRQEVDVAQVAHRRGAEDHRVAGAHDDGSARLAGELSGLEGDLLAADLHRDAAHVKHAHVFAFPSGRPVGGPFLQNSRSRNAGDVTAGRQLGEVARRARRESAPPANAAGVPVTPARIPVSKSRRTRSATAAERRSALEALEVEAERSRALPQVRVVDVALVGVDRVDHLQNAPALERGGLGRGVQRRRARVLAGEREMADARAAAGASRIRSQAARSAGRRGRDRRSPPAPRRGRGRRAPDRRTAALVSSRIASASPSAASASKIRLAPGISSGVGDSCDPAHDPLGVDQHQGAVRRPPVLEVGAVGARDLALGVEVGQQRASRARAACGTRCGTSCRRR